MRIGSLRLLGWWVAAVLLLVVAAGCGGGGDSGTVAVALTATPGYFLNGDRVLLQWNSQNAGAVKASNFDASAVSGTKTVYPTQATTYWITVANGQKTASASVTVNPLNVPTQPQLGSAGELFSVNTPNYFYLYGQTPISSAPFNDPYRMSDTHFPVTLSYESLPSPPWDFNLRDESEQSIRVWAQADPRVCAVSGASPTHARIRIKLVESITYNNTPNIIGLTKGFYGDIGPYYEVYIATIDPATDGLPMPYVDMQKTLAHELGHALGLGHADDNRDLMHFQCNDAQGNTPSSFLTYGDAMAMWTTLTDDRINYYSDRPIITAFTRGARTYQNRDLHPRITDEGGVVLCATRRPRYP